MGLSSRSVVLATQSDNPGRGMKFPDPGHDELSETSGGVVTIAPLSDVGRVCWWLHPVGSGWVVGHLVVDGRVGSWGTWSWPVGFTIASLSESDRAAPVGPAPGDDKRPPVMGGRSPWLGCEGGLGHACPAIVSSKASRATVRSRSVLMVGSFRQMS